jgi:rfaE bifunctional protein kinase chain/domain
MEIYNIDKSLLQEIFNNFEKQTALVIGDLMIDSYIFGKVERISPEAPVPVVEVTRREQRPGGAANVALNIKALNANAIVAGIVGDDKEADVLRSLLENKGIDTSGLIQDASKPTTVKTRVIGNRMQLLRVDDEKVSESSQDIQERFLLQIKRILENNKVDVVIFEDYDKGVITPWLIEEVVKLAHERNIIVTADPKKKNFLHYKNVDLFKPNLKETQEGLKIKINLKNGYDEAINAANDLQIHLNAKNVIITLSSYGMVFCNHHKTTGWGASLLRGTAVDVSGAGDTVIAVASLLLAQKVNIGDAAFIANIAGGLVCEHVGVVPVNFMHLKYEAEKRI